MIVMKICCFMRLIFHMKYDTYGTALNVFDASPLAFHTLELRLAVRRLRGIKSPPRRVRLVRGQERCYNRMELLVAPVIQMRKHALHFPVMAFISTGATFCIADDRKAERS